MKTHIFPEKLTRRSIYVTVLLCLISCSSVLPVNDWAKAWIGEDFSRVERAARLPGYLSKNGLSITQRVDENGKHVYVDPQGPDCSVIWFVSPQGKVENFRVEGKSCW